MGFISIQEAAVDTGLPMERLYKLAEGGYIKTQNRPVMTTNNPILQIDRDSLDTYLANHDKPKIASQEIIIRKKENAGNKMIDILSTRKGYIEFLDPIIGNVKIEMGFEEITPEQAEKYLQKNIQNRKPNSRHVASYVEEMLAGKWKIIPGGLAFDTQGNMINGQHTAIACKRSGVTIICQISRGIPREYCPAMDAGKKKTLSDHMNMLGRPERNEHFAIARLLENGITEQVHREYTNDQQIDLIAKYWDSVNFAVSLAKGVRYMHAPIAVVIARASYSQDRGRLKKFVEVFRSGMPESKQDWAANRLRNYMQEDIPGAYLRDIRTEIYARAEFAVSAFLRRYPLKALYRSDHEQYLLPGETQEIANKKMGVIKNE